MKVHTFFFKIFNQKSQKFRTLMAYLGVGSLSSKQVTQLRTSRIIRSKTASRVLRMSRQLFVGSYLQ